MDAKQLSERLRGAANRCTRYNADVALLCEAALEAAQQLDRMVQVGKLQLGDTDGAEIDDWDVDFDRRPVDAINESRPPDITRLPLFTIRPNV